MLRKVSSPRKRTTKKARLNPLVLLLDAALTGELDVVKEAVKEVSWRLAASQGHLPLSEHALRWFLCHVVPGPLFKQTAAVQGRLGRETVTLGW